MRKFLSIVAQAVKAVVVVATASAMRIIKAEGTGVFERAIQGAVAEIAARYVRSVTP